MKKRYLNISQMWSFLLEIRSEAWYQRLLSYSYTTVHGPSWFEEEEHYKCLSFWLAEYIIKEIYNQNLKLNLKCVATDETFFFLLVSPALHTPFLIPHLSLSSLNLRFIPWVYSSLSMPYSWGGNKKDNSDSKEQKVYCNYNSMMIM